MAGKNLLWKNNNLEYIDKAIKDLNWIITPNERGGYRVHNYLLLELIIESLTDSFNSTQHASYDELRMAVSKGIRRFSKYKFKSTKTLLRAINTELKKTVFHEKNKSYIALLFTPLILFRKLNIENQISIEGSNIIFSNWHTVRKNIQIDMLFSQIRPSDNSNFKSNTIPTLIYFNEKESLLYSNFEEHLKPYEIFRSAINYSLNFGHLAIGGRSFLPYNKFLPSKYTGLFDQNGRYLTHMHTFAQHKIPSMFSVKKADLIRAHGIFEKYSSENIINDIDILTGKLLMHYNYALDSLDFGTCYFGLWRVLENIIFPKGSPNYTKVGSRATAILKGSVHVKQALGAMTVARQKFFHKEAFFPSNTNMVDSLKFIIEYLLEWMLTPHDDISTEKDLMTFIDKNENSI